MSEDRRSRSRSRSRSPDRGGDTGGAGGDDNAPPPIDNGEPKPNDGGGDAGGDAGGDQGGEEVKLYVGNLDYGECIRCVVIISCYYLLLLLLSIGAPGMIGCLFVASFQYTII